MNNKKMKFIVSICLFTMLSLALCFNSTSVFAENDEITIATGCCGFGANEDISVCFSNKTYKITSAQDMAVIIGEWIKFEKPQVEVKLQGTKFLSKYELFSYPSLFRTIGDYIKENKDKKIRILVVDNTEQYCLYLKPAFDKGIITKDDFKKWMLAVKERFDAIKESWIEFSKVIQKKEGKNFEILFDNILDIRKDDQNFEDFMENMTDMNTTPSTIFEGIRDKKRKQYLQEASLKDGNFKSKRILTFDSLCSASWVAVCIRSKMDDNGNFIGFENVVRIEECHEHKQEGALKKNIKVLENSECSLPEIDHIYSFYDENDFKKFKIFKEEIRIFKEEISEILKNKSLSVSVKNKQIKQKTEFINRTKNKAMSFAREISNKIISESGDLYFTGFKSTEDDIIYARQLYGEFVDCFIGPIIKNGIVIYNAKN